MSDIEQPQRGYTTKDIEAMKTAPPRRRRRWIVLTLLALVLLPALIFASWVYGTLSYVYSTGERAGYVQKFSRKGWLCKTWEGELAMVTIPGTMPQIFHFTVRDDSIARVVQETMGNRVALTYEQHPGVPTDCFGETEYYVIKARLVGP